MDRRQVFAGIALAATAGTAYPATPARATSPTRITGTDGVHLFHRDWGEGRPIVFLAGWALPSDCWCYQMLALSERGFRTVAYDRRGHGRSDDPGRNYDYDTLADDLAAVLDSLDLAGVTLVAHSMAGGEAVRYLTRHGRQRRVARVLFLAPTLPFLLKTADNPDGIDRQMFEGLRHVWRHDYPTWLANNARPFFMPETPEPMLDWGRGLMLQCSMKAVIECNRAMVETDFRAELQSLAVPSLVIQGDRDASAPLPLTGILTTGLIPGAQIKVYQGAPHGLFLTHVDRFNADLAAFAGGQP